MKTKREIIEEMKETVVEDAMEFVKKKGHDERSMVINLETGEFYGYLLPPVNALKAAYIANMMRRVGNISDSELVVHFSASKEFEELDSKIEMAAGNTLLRLGSLYTYANEAGKTCIEDMVENTMAQEIYKRYF